jgi:hypothetical protein
MHGDANAPTADSAVDEGQTLSSTPNTELVSRGTKGDGDQYIHDHFR